MAVFVTQLDRICQVAYLNDNGLANYARRTKMTSMPNNLDAMIARSGMSKREVAALKGITPETLSRQIHGKIQMTLQDAERYAKILDCTPQDVLFVLPPVPIVGYCKITRCDPDEDNCPPTGVRIEREISAGKTMGKVYLQTYMQTNTAAVIWSADDQYSGIWEHWKNALQYIEREPIEKGYVSEASIQHESYALLETPVKEFGVDRRLVCGIVYPEPGGLYTVHNNDTGLAVRGQKLLWAAASLSVSYRPKLRGIEIVLDK
jgi:DNA-binding Xre family transcriptional regulator